MGVGIPSTHILPRFPFIINRQGDRIISLTIISYRTGQSAESPQALRRSPRGTNRETLHAPQRPVGATPASAFTFRNKSRCQNASSLQADLSSGRDPGGSAAISSHQPPTASTGGSRIPMELLKQGSTRRWTVIRGREYERTSLSRSRSGTLGRPGQLIHAVCCGQHGLSKPRWMPTVGAKVKVP